MSHIRKVTTPKGLLKWQARYIEPSTNRERSRNFDRKIDAQRFLDGVTTSVVTSSYIAPERGRATVKQMSEVWIAGKVNWASTTRARNENALRVHVLPRWGAVRLDRVEHLDVQRWVGEQTRHQAGASVRKNVGVLSAILQLAVADKRLPANPCDGLNLPSSANKRRRYLTMAQVHDLADAGGPGRLPVYVLAMCGLRWSELAGLRVHSFDPLRRRLMIERVIVEIDGGELEEKDPKDYERRSVPVPAFLVDDLVAEIAGRGRGAYLFAAPEGGVLRNRNARRAWFDDAAAAIGEAGLTPHEMRHTAASLAVSAGANVLAVSRMLGHAKPSITLDIYSDLFDSDLDAVAERLDEIARSESSRRVPTDSSRIPARISDLESRRQAPAGQ